MSDAMVSTTLNKEELRRIREILGRTPTVAQNGGNYQQAKTASEYIAQLDSIVQYLKYEMEEHEKAADELDALKRDLAAAGRVLKLIQGPDDSKKAMREVFKAVWAAMAIRHEFTTDDLEKMARDHGVDL